MRAFLHVIRAGETNQNDDAYTLVNGGSHFTAPPWVHPWAGISTTAGAKACGAYQFLGTTWAACDRALGLGGDFSPVSQDVAAVYLIEGRGALEAVMAGDLPAAINKLHQEWVSLPALDFRRVIAVFQQYGGRVLGDDLPGPSTGHGTPQTQGKPMPALALLQLFGPILSGLIPQISGLLKPESEVAKRNVGIAEILLNTITSAAGTPSLEQAVTAMQTDSAVKAKVQQAVVTQPEIMATLQITEIGGGVAAAREADLKAAIAEVPFWKASAVFWVSMALLPMIYWYVGGSIVGGIEIPDDWPWYAQLPLKMFGKVWDDGAKVGLANLVVGLVLGGIVGVYYGVSVTQAKQAAAAEKS